MVATSHVPLAAPKDGECSDVFEIELTPAMLRAGVMAWCEGDDDFFSPAEIVTKIYTDMMRAHAKERESKA